MIVYLKTDNVLNPATCFYENGKYLANIMDDSTTMYDENIEGTVPSNLNKKKATCKTQSFYILLGF